MPVAHPGSGLLAWLPWRRFVVADTSMRPTLEPRDRLLVLRWPKVRVGDVVVVRDPHASGTFLVKRVAAVTAGGGLDVRGENPNVSRDSREFGVVPRDHIVGRVALRYGPAGRRGWLSNVR